MEMALHKEFNSCQYRVRTRILVCCSVPLHWPIIYRISHI